MDLAEFLLARIAEDEAAAREATGSEWHATLYDERDRHYDIGADPWEDGDTCVLCTGRYEDDTRAHGPLRHDAEHIARHDPARVLADCEAKRAIVEVRQTIDAHIRQVALTDHEEARDARNTRAGLDVALKALALPYASHADYRDEWKPRITG